MIPPGGVRHPGPPAFDASVQLGALRYADHEAASMTTA
jgi:hypothetical protein